MKIRDLLGLSGGMVEDTADPPERTTNMRADVQYRVSGFRSTDRNVEVVDPDDPDELALMLKRKLQETGWRGSNPTIQVTPTTGPVRDRWSRTYTSPT